MGVGSGDGAYSVQRQSSCGGGDLLGDGNASERGQRLPRHWYCEGVAEGGNIDFKFLLCSLHHLT